MKKKYRYKYTVVIIIVLALIIVYRLMFSYTIFRFYADSISENIIGKKYTTVNIINPFKINKIKKNIKLFMLNDIWKKVTRKEKIELLYNTLQLESDFEIMDIYEEDGQLYIFVKFKEKENLKIEAFNKLLIVSDKNGNVERIGF